jgi:DUF4097 and DUF4098 domain-containing protein YvlB
MRLLLFLQLLLLPGGLHGQETPAPYVERVEKQFAFYPGGKLEIVAEVPGSIRIVGWQKAIVRMEAERIAYYLSPEKAKELLGKNPVRVRYTQSAVTIRNPGLAESGLAAEINYIVYVPGDKTDINVKMLQGDFAVSRVNGWIEAAVREGSLEAKSVSGYFSANTLKGDITVEMSGNRWQGLEFAAATQLGSIDLHLPIDYSAAIQLETRNGKITVDYPPQEVDGELQPPDIVIGKTAQSLKASLGRGGAPVKLATAAGDISLIKIGVAAP